MTSPDMTQGENPDFQTFVILSFLCSLLGSSIRAKVYTLLRWLLSNLSTWYAGSRVHLTTCARQHV